MPEAFERSPGKPASVEGFGESEMSVRKTVLIRDLATEFEMLQKRVQKERVKRICNVVSPSVLESVTRQTNGSGGKP